MENYLKKIYSQARRDVGREWYKYMESIKPEADRLLKAYEDAKLTDDKDLIKKTGKEYGQFLREKTYMNEKYKSMLDTTTTKLANVNEIALSYLNNEMPKVYVTNYNQVSKDMPAGISFDIVDENTVKNLVKDNPKLLPTKKLDIPKDKRWNQKAINAQVLQGIIQGESIPEMAKRLTPIMDRNKTSAIRNARTMTTSAQNKGRLDSYKAAQDNGVVLHKVWMATNSERTRAWHADLNGVELDIDEPFENDYGEIMFPGDPDADPGNLYNCRCTMRTHIIGFRREDGSIKYIEGEEPKDADEFKIIDDEDIFDKEKVDRFIPVTNKQDAFDSLQNTFTDVDESILKLNEELLVDNVNQFNKLNSRFGVVKANDGSYFSTNNTKYVAQSSGGYRDGQYEISLSNKYYKKIDVYQEQYDRGQQSGYKMPSSDDYRNTYTITHEYGHILEGYVSRNRTDFDAIKADIESTWGHNPKVIPRYLNDAYDKSEENLAKDIRNEIVDIAKSNNKNFDLEANLSKYGHTNDYEFFAEVFANSQCGQPNELGVAMQQWLEKEGF